MHRAQHSIEADWYVLIEVNASTIATIMKLQCPKSRNFEILFIQSCHSDNNTCWLSIQTGAKITSISVEPVNSGHHVNSDMHLQTVEIQMRRLPIRTFTVRLVNLFFIPIIKI